MAFPFAIGIIIQKKNWQHCHLTSFESNGLVSFRFVLEDLGRHHQLANVSF